MPETFCKDPDALLDYSVDWGPWLAGDLISSSSWIVPAELAKEDETNTPTSATVWLSGGVKGEYYTVTNRIQTVGGRTDDRSLSIAVQNR